VPTGTGFDFSKIKIPEHIEVICITQNETSTGVVINMNDIYVLKKKTPQTLIAIDIVSSAPYVTIDFKYIDMAFFSVQKGFGLPSGLGLLIVNNKAIKKTKLLAGKNLPIGGYHDFLSLYESVLTSQTPETPNILNIYLLGKVTQDLLAYGVEKMRKETEEKAKLLYAFFDKHPKYKPFVAKEHRSPTTLVINTKGDTEKIVTKLAKKGYAISKGYGDRNEDQIRIANFPAQTIKQVKGLLASF
jgi:phosphoserine aminotransferase